MTMRMPNQCESCERLTSGPTLGLYDDPWRCRAYPEGIPVVIWAKGEDHRTPRGDERSNLTYKTADKPGAEETFKEWEAFHNAS